MLRSSPSAAREVQRASSKAFPLSHGANSALAGSHLLAARKKSNSTLRNHTVEINSFLLSTFARNISTLP